MIRLYKLAWLSIAVTLTVVFVFLAILAIHLIGRHPDCDYGKAEALNYAIIAHDIPKIKNLILEDKKILDATGVNGSTPMCCAVETGQTNIVDLLLKSGANLNQPGPMGITPLHCAAARPDEAMVEFLLVRGANLNSKAFNGITPLHMAVNYKQRRIVEILILRGADLTARGNFDGQSATDTMDLYTPLQWAIKIGAFDMAELLQTSGAL